MKKLKRVVVKEELVALTGKVDQAIVLNQFIYWSERVKDVDKYLEEEVERARKFSDGSVESEEDLKERLSKGWIYKTAPAMKEECMFEKSSTTMERIMNVLVDKGWLDRRRNPKYKWDKTYQYRVNILKIQQDLMKLGYALEGYSLGVENKQESDESPNLQNEPSRLQNEPSKLQNEGLRLQNEAAIPEITSKIINQEIINKESIIQKEIENLELPSLTKKVLKNKKDRLILFNIDLLEVEVLFSNSELEDKAFADVLMDVLNSEIKKSFKRKMEVSIQNFIENMNNKMSLEPKRQKIIREEMVPEFLQTNRTDQKLEKRVQISEERKRAIWRQVHKLNFNNTEDVNYALNPSEIGQ